MSRTGAVIEYKENTVRSQKKIPLVPDSELKRLYNFCNEYMKGDEIFIHGRKCHPLQKCY